MKEGNSASRLLKLMKEEGYNKDTDLAIGVVVSVDPFEVDMGTYTISEEDLFIAELLTEYTREVTIDIKNIAGNTKTGGDGHTHPLDIFKAEKAELTFHSPLQVGDNVIVIVDDSDFYVIDRVV